jgi:hypothetical protein
VPILLQKSKIERRQKSREIRFFGISAGGGWLPFPLFRASIGGRPGRNQIPEQFLQ